MITVLYFTQLCLTLRALVKMSLPIFKEINSPGFKTLPEEQEVEFEVGQGQKGPQVTNVTIL